MLYKKKYSAKNAQSSFAEQLTLTLVIVSVHADF
jgi:hypothetical protein